MSSAVERVEALARATLSGRPVSDAFDRAAWAALGRVRATGLCAPRALGGLGLDASGAARALMALGRHSRDGGLMLSLNAHLWGCVQPLVAFGSPALKRRLVPRLCSGELIGSHAFAEPGAGSDAARVGARARRRGAGWILDGRKAFATNSPVAGVFVVFARTGGAGTLSAFCVERSTPGLRTEPGATMGARSAPTGGLSLKGCVVPSAALLGRAGEGLAVFHHAMEWERGLILASAVGAMERRLEDAVRAANERRQFGRPVGRFQMVLKRVADMKARVETGKALIERFAAARDAGRSAMAEAAAAKLVISEAWVDSCLDALQVEGARGYQRGSAAERELSDALGARLYSGTSEIQRLLLARFAGLR